METFLVIVVAIALCGVATYFFQEQQRQRAVALHALAARLGWSFQDAPPLTILPHPERFELFTQGSRREIRNYLSGEIDGGQFAIFDYGYVTGGGNSQSTCKQTVLHVHSPRLDLPLFTLRPENVLHRIGGLAGYQDIDLEGHPRFSREMLLRGRDESSIRSVFEPDVVAFFEAKSNHCAAGAGPDLFFWRAAQIVPDQETAGLLDRGRDLLARFVSRAPQHPHVSA
jgi:hypothetical protein